MSKQRPAIVKIDDKTIDFSILNRNHNSNYAIEDSNRKIFELLNPMNKYSKDLIMDSIVKFKKPMLEICQNNKFKFSNFDTAIYKLTRDNFGTPSSNKISALKKNVLERDPVVLNTLRTALIEDTGLPLVIDFVSNSDNCIDFYFDTIKDYTKDKIEGIVLNDTGVVNKNSLSLVALINMKYIINSISENVNVTSDKLETGDSVRETCIALENEIQCSFFAAMIRDDFRMRMTEKLMLVFKLMMNNNLSFLNATQDVDSYELSKNERVAAAIKEFVSNNKITIDSINDDEANSLPFKTFMKICLDIDFNPLTLLTILELSDYDVSQILNHIFTDCDIQHFASHKTLQIKEENEASVNEIKDVLLINRLLPLCFVVVYFLQNGLKYRDFQNIDNILEEEVHSKKLILSLGNGTNRLNEIHKINDDFYNDLRHYVQNPLNTTERIKIIIKDVVFGTYNAEIETDEPDPIVKE